MKKILKRLLGLSMGAALSLFYSLYHNRFYKESRDFYNVNCSFRFRSRRNKRLKEPG